MRVAYRFFSFDNVELECVLLAVSPHEQRSPLSELPDDDQLDHPLEPPPPRRLPFPTAPPSQPRHARIDRSEREQGPPCPYLEIDAEYVPERAARERELVGETRTEQEATEFEVVFDSGRFRRSAGDRRQDLVLWSCERLGWGRSGRKETERERGKEGLGRRKRFAVQARQEFGLDAEVVPLWSSFRQ